jgi:TRAP-type C4-dicarboxylate transport system permease small subunit
MRKIYGFLCKTETLLCGIGFILLVALVFMSAILRSFKVSMSWNMDLAMLLLAWTAFLGADIAYRNGQLVGIDIVTRNLPKAAQKIVAIFVFLVILVGLVVITFFGTKLAISEKLRKYQSMPIPFSAVTLSVVLASASMAFSTLLKIKRCIIGFNKKEDD